MSKFKSSLDLLLFFILTLSLKYSFILFFISCCLPCGNFFSLCFSLPYLAIHKYLPPDYFNKENGTNPKVLWFTKLIPDLWKLKSLGVGVVGSSWLSLPPQLKLESSLYANVVQCCSQYPYLLLLTFVFRILFAPLLILSPKSHSSGFRKY